MERMMREFYANVKVKEREWALEEVERRKPEMSERGIQTELDTKVKLV
jgi:hypothetical protein